MHCIYCGKDTSQTTSREHVISACFGGKARLPLGMVCDDCNKKIFSKLEAYVAREGTFGIIRSFEGPGKRGSMDPKKAFVGSMVFGQTDCGARKLTYTMLGKPYALPNVLFNMKDFLKDGKVVNSFETEEQAKGFFEKMMSLDLEKVKKRKDKKHLKEGEVLFFYNLPQHLRNHKNHFKGFEEKYFQLNVHPSVEEVDLVCLLQSLKKCRYGLEKEEKRESQVLQEHNFSIDLKLLNRYICKLFVNCLAYFKGVELVENEAFDAIKSFVVRGEGDYPVQPIGSDLIWNILDKKRLKKTTDILSTI